MRRFLLVWLGGLIAVLLAVVAFNALVDPYGLVGTPRIAGFNADKLAAADWPRVTKPYLVERARPTTLLLGSSSVDVGLDPEASVWPAEFRPVFNLSIDGGNLQNYFDWERHALVTTTPKLMLVAVSLEESLEFAPSGVQGPASQLVQAQYDYASRLRVTRDGAPNPDYLSGRLNDAAFAVLSLRALGDSVLTPLRQNDRWRTHQTALGWNSAGNFVRWLETEGSYSLVIDKDRNKAATYLAWSRAPRTSLTVLPDIIAAAQSRGTEVKVFILPNYVDQMEILRQLGLGPVFDQWKARVGQIVDHAAKGADSTKAPVSLWDFSGYTPYTTEPLPGPGDTKNPLRWFYEAVHFRPELGEKMVGRMLGSAAPTDLGSVLTPANLAANIAAYHRAEQEWVASHPADVARVATILAAARKAAR